MCRPALGGGVGSLLTNGSSGRVDDCEGGSPEFPLGSFRTHGFCRSSGHGL